MNPSHRVVLFDLGGVLLELGGVEAFGSMLGATDPEGIWQTWFTSEWVRRYEAGRCSTEDFVQGMVSSHALDVDDAAFFEAFRRWPIGPFPGAHELVLGVRDDVVAACLSNTNALHWGDQEAGFGWAALFSHTFLSHEMQKVKPDADAFHHVVEALGVDPGEIVFLDDNRVNVEGAERAGLDAHRVRGVEESRVLLAGLGLLA